MSESDADRLALNPLFARPGESRDIPQFSLPEDPMLPETAYQFVHDEAMLDGNARLNLATFVGTWMDPMASKLYAETFDKNMIDKDEYPQTAAIEERCWRILAEVWNSPDPSGSIGTSTIGSSEACMLGGLALKRRWQHARRAAGKSTERPNLVMSSAVQVCWLKFCNYFDVETRTIPISDEHKVMDGFELDKYVDENTIGVVPIMGVTYTGMYEEVTKISDALDQIQKDTGLDVPIHIDAASGGFITPFLQPDRLWDFRVDRVHSISVSGHKYGLVYPGLGWVVWKDKEFLPDDLIFYVSYLGGQDADLRPELLAARSPGAAAVLQLPAARVARVTRQCSRRASTSRSTWPTRSTRMGPFTLWNDASDIPVFAWELKKDHTSNWDLYDLQDQLRQRGWLVPAYPLPDDLAERTVQRVVVRNGLSRDLADRLLDSLRSSVDYLDSLPGPLPREQKTEMFHH